MRVLVFIVACATSINCGLAQSVTTDTTFVEIALAHAIAQYESAITGQQPYYNGSAYVEAPHSEGQHPFFLTEEWDFGSLKFEGQDFAKVPMLYDIVSDQVITETPNGNLIVINPQKVNGFTLNNHHFIRIDNSTVNNSLPQTGFYNVLYNGNTKLIALREKKVQEKIADQQLHISFDIKNRYYILKKGRFYPVKNKKTILKVLEEQKNSLRALISKNGIRFKKNREQALAQIAEFYDTLISQ